MSGFSLKKSVILLLESLSAEVFAAQGIYLRHS